MAILTASEVFQIAITIEENGERFYHSFSEKLRGNLEKELFRYLADEEKKHRHTFKELLKEVENTTPEVSYPDEYSDYFKAYSEDLIFTEASLQKAVERIKDTRSACEFGIRRELDSILYYQEIKSFTPEDERDIIDDIIKEERSHFLKLTEMKRGL